MFTFEFVFRIRMSNQNVLHDGAFSYKFFLADIALEWFVLDCVSLQMIVEILFVLIDPLTLITPTARRKRKKYELHHVR